MCYNYDVAGALPEGSYANVPKIDSPLSSGVSVWCSCIKAARKLGVKIPPQTNSEDLESNSIPMIGGLVLLSYDDSDHVAVITGFTEKGFMVQEGNYENCQYTEREVWWDDHFIRGFYVLE